jgi:hypothetical protein
MKLSELETYYKNFEYFQKLVTDGAELTILPVKLKDQDTEFAALCTKNEDGVFPHAVLVWDNPHDLFVPTLVEEEEKDDTPKIIV